MSISIEFQPWSTFRARKDNASIRSWLQQVAERSREAFERGMASSTPGPSKKGQYPAIRTGALMRSISTQVSSDSMIIGTNTHYSLYLRDGTKKMDSHKMSHDALKEGLQDAGRLKHWAEWVRG